MSEKATHGDARCACGWTRREHADPEADYTCMAFEQAAPPEPRRIGGRTREEVDAIIGRLNHAFVHGDGEELSAAMTDAHAWLSAAFSEPSR